MTHVFDALAHNVHQRLVDYEKFGYLPMKIHVSPI